MAKFGHWFRPGVLWVFIAIGVGFAGLWFASSRGGVWSVVGWAVAAVACVFAILSAWHLSRVTRLQIEGMRLARDHSERVAELQRKCHEAAQRLDENEASDPSESDPRKRADSFFAEADAYRERAEQSVGRAWRSLRT